MVWHILTTPVYWLVCYPSSSGNTRKRKVTFIYFWQSSASRLIYLTVLQSWCCRLLQRSQQIACCRSWHLQSRMYTSTSITIKSCQSLAYLILWEIVRFRNLINLTQISLVQTFTKSHIQINTHWQGNERNVKFNRKRNIFTYKTYSKSTVCQKCHI